MSDKSTHIIAITGTIGSGKSAVGEIVAKAGAFVTDTDFLAKELQAEGTEGAGLIKAAFGDKLYEGGFLNRKALGQQVFGNPENLNKLNGIMHPLIYDAMLREFGNARKQGHALIFALVPLLFEAGEKWTRRFDEVWIVAASREACIKRVMARDKCAAADAELRIGAQMPLEQKLEAAKSLGIPVTVIENDNGEAKLYRQVMKALKPHKKLLRSQSANHIAQSTNKRRQVDSKRIV